MSRVKTSLSLLLVLVVVVGLTMYLQVVSLDSRQASDVTPAAATVPADKSTTAIGALGRIEPGDGVVRLAARSLSGQASIVAKLRVREGDQVKAGQVVAELDSTDQLQATFQLTQAQIEVARKRLEQVQAGAKTSDIAAQRAEIERLNVELENARRDLKRYEGLNATKSIAEAELDEVRTRAESLMRSSRQASDRLTSLSEIRPVDVDVARAELESSIREAVRARAEYMASLIRSPLDGRIIKIYAWPGEEVGPDGILEMAKTDLMYVLAEVAEVDMARVRAGQRAQITGLGLPAALVGTVETVGLKVRENSVMQLSPAQFSDARIVEARIRLDNGAQVAHLIHLRVNVVIDPQSSTSPRADGR